MDEQKPFNQQHHSHRHLQQVGNQLQFAQSLLPSSDHEHQMKAFDPYPAQLSSTGRTNPFFNISGLTADIHGSNSQSMSPLICSGDLSRSAQPGIVQYSNYTVTASDPSLQSLQSLQARSKPVVTAAINPAASSAFFAMANDHRLSRTADNHHHRLLHHLQESSDQARGEISNKNSMASRYTVFHHNPTRDGADHMDLPLPDSHCSILSDRVASSDPVAATAERKNVHNVMSFNGGPSSSSRYGYGNTICAGNSSSDSLMIQRHNGNGMSSLYQDDHGDKRDGRRADYMMVNPSPLNGSAEINTVSSGSNYAMIVNSQGSNHRANPSHGELMDHHQMNYLAGLHGSSQRPPPPSSDGVGDGGGSHYTRDLSLSLSAQKTSHQLQANESHDQICPNLHDNLRTNNADSTVSAHHHHHHHHHHRQAPLSAVMMMQQKTRYVEEESWSTIQSSVYLKATQQILREMAVRLSHKSGGHGSYQEAQKLSNHNNTVVIETAANTGAGEKIKAMEIQRFTSDHAGSNPKETEQENDGDGGGDGDTKKQSQDLMARNPRFTQETAAVAKLEEVRINHEAHTYHHRSDPPDSSLMTVIQRPSIPANSANSAASAAAMAPVRAANTIAGISSSDRSQIRRKLSIMLEELDKKYRMFEEEMRVVMTSFEGAANKCDDDKDNNNSMAMVMAGVAPYKDMAAKAVETQFRVLRESITHQACALMITTNLGPSAGSGSKLIHGGEAGHHSSTNPNFLNASHWNDASSMDPGNSRSRRMRLLDHQFRQQRAQAQAQAQQQHQTGSLFHSQPWRPQRGLPERSVSLLRAWLFDHFLHPYPKDTEKLLLARQTGLTRNQVSNWFINARVRLWKPLVEEMYQEEKKMPQVWQGNDASCTLGNSAGTSSNPHLQQESISRGHYDFTRNESEKHAGVPSKFGSQLMEMQDLVSMQGGAINMEASKFLKNSLVPSRHEYVDGYRDDANDHSHHHHQQFVSANQPSETTVTIAGRVLEGDQQCGSTHTWPFIQHQSILPLDGHQGQHYGTNNAALMRFGSGAGGVTLTLGLQQHSNTSLSAAMGCDVDDIDPHVNEIPMPFRM